MDIKEIQFKHLKNLYAEEAKRYGRNISMRDIIKIRRRLYSLPNSYVFRKYTFPFNNKINIEQLNLRLGGLDVDVKTLTEYNKQVYDTIATIGFVSKVYTELIKNISRRIKKKAKSLTAGVVSERESYSIDFKSDRKNTSGPLVLTDKITAVLPPKKVSYPTLRNTDISIKIEEQNGTTENIDKIEFTGEKVDPFRWGRTNPYIIRITTKGAQPIINIETTVKANVTDVNTIVIDVDTAGIGGKIIIYHSENNVEFNQIGEGIIRDNVARVSINRNKLKYVKILHQIGRGIKKNNLVVYTATYQNILFANTAPTESIVYETKEIALDFNPRELSLIVDQNKPDGVDINYYIRTSEEDDWSRLYPANLYDRNNIFPINRVTNSLKNIRPTGYRWELEPLYYGDLDLYNILNSDDFENQYQRYGSFVIEDVPDIGHVIKSNDENIEIQWDTMKLFRGVNSYRKEYTNRTVTRESNNISYQVKKESTGFSFIHLRIPVSERHQLVESEPGVSGYDRLIVDYPIHKGWDTNRQDFDLTVPDLIIYDEDGNVVENTNIVEGRWITFDEPIAINNEEIYTIKYSTKLYNTSELRSINVNNIVVSSIDRIYTKDDFEYDRANQRIRLDPTQEHPEELTITFDYSKSVSDEYPIYITEMYLEAERELRIIPFTNSEIDAGNYHIIDGRDVSSLEIIRLSNGWHHIESTNPFLRNPDDPLDFNILTGEYTRAALLIPNDVYIRGYDLSLRKVTPFRLSNNINPFDKRFFAVDIIDDPDDDTKTIGKVLLNRKPEFITEKVLYPNNVMSHTEGKDLLCKWSLNPDLADPPYIHEQYIPVPETFELTFDSIRKDAVNSVMVKIEIINRASESVGETTINEVIINNVG